MDGGERESEEEQEMGERDMKRAEEARASDHDREAGWRGGAKVI